MDFAYAAAGIAVGILFGALLVWFYLSRRLKDNSQTGSSDRNSVLLLTERVQTRDLEIQKLQVSVQARAEELSRLNQELSRQMAELAAANERNLRLNDLQLLIDQKETQAGQSREQISILE